MGAPEDRVAAGLRTWLCVGAQPASAVLEGPPVGAAMCALVLGAFVFKRREQRFADVI